MMRQAKLCVVLLALVLGWYGLSERVFAWDYTQSTNFGVLSPGDHVHFRVTPPKNSEGKDAIVTAGTCDQPGGFIWVGGPASWNGTVPPDFAAQHIGRFSGEYGYPGTGGPSRALTWKMDTAALVVKVESITVKSGATQNNVIGAENWAAIKSSGDVIIEVTLKPNTDEAASYITWTGGDPVAGYPRQRKVSKSVSAKTAVKAKCGSSSASLNVWVLWVNMDIRSSGNKSTNNNKDFPSGFGDDTLGPLTDEDNDITIAETTGKIEAIGTLSPAGVYAVVRSGWDIKRWIICQDFYNGNPSSPENRDDTSYAPYKDLIPDNDDKIYDIDGPTNGLDLDVNHTEEVSNNFRQWITWNEEKCSEEVTWHYQAWVDDDLDVPHKPKNDDTEKNDVGTGTITIPANAHYSPR